jgi:hypothetical protein
VKLKKIHITEKQYIDDHKIKHIQYTVYPDTPMVVQLIKKFPRISWNFQFTTLLTTVYSSTISQCMISQNPFWYSSLKSISILSCHINKRPSEWKLSFSILQSKSVQVYICSMHSTFLTHFATALRIPVSDKQYKLWNSTLSIIFLQFPLSSLQTLFSSLCSQTKPAYEWQKALHILKSPFLCYLYHASIF